MAARLAAWARRGPHVLARLPGRAALPPPCTWFSTDGADEYRGPGGLTALQIFDAMQKGKDEGDPYWKSDEALRQQLNTGAHAFLDHMPDDLSRLTVGELQEALRKLGVGFADCLDKESLVSRLQASITQTEK